MQYRVTHSTKYTYSEPVPICQNKLHLAPRSTPHQTCHDFRLLVHPQPAEIRSRTDYFGNRVDYFSVDDAHRGLAVTATSVVEVAQRNGPAVPSDSTSWEDVAEHWQDLRREDAIETRLFTFGSEFAQPEPTVDTFARASFPPGRPMLEAVLDLTRRIHEQFTYDPRTTNVSTPVTEVFEQKSGVCQDFAHLEIVCLRTLGLPARYVSGYLRTKPPPGKPRLVGADASHAWISAFCGAAGWIDFDPTNSVIPNGEHITVAYGRDYGDVCPIQGVFVGGGEHSMSVSVDVEAV